MYLFYVAKPSPVKKHTGKLPGFPMVSAFVTSLTMFFFLPRKGEALLMANSITILNISLEDETMSNQHLLSEKLSQKTVYNGLMLPTCRYACPMVRK